MTQWTFYCWKRVTVAETQVSEVNNIHVGRLKINAPALLILLV